jgi:thiamine pyrophosphate-dependent acetolactate synthase large subunit-like protein
VRRADFLEIFVQHRGEAPTIVGPGIAGRELFKAGHRDATLYQMDMSYAAPLCLGLALASADQKKIVAIEGDGSMLMGLGVLTTIGRYQPTNLVLLILDNGRYSSIESNEYPADETALAVCVKVDEVARACGIQNAIRVSSEQEADAVLRRAMSEPGPWVIVANVPHIPPQGDPRAVSTPDLFENSMDFAEAVGRVLAVQSAS